MLSDIQFSVSCKMLCFYSFFCSPLLKSREVCKVIACADPGSGKCDEILQVLWFWLHFFNFPSFRLSFISFCPNLGFSSLFHYDLNMTCTYGNKIKLSINSLGWLFFLDWSTNEKISLKKNKGIGHDQCSCQVQIPLKRYCTGDVPSYCNHNHNNLVKHKTQHIFFNVTI